MANSNLKAKAVSGLIWKFAERWSAQIVSFVVSIILARMLMPAQYGEVAMILVFINIADVFVSDGFSTALIQKKDADKTDFSTMFYCSLAISILLYGILFACAPLIAGFYNNQNLIWLLRIFSLKLPIAAINSIQHAYVSRHMLFKKFFFSTIIGTITSGAVGIAMAYFGCGTWALIAQYLVNSVMDTAILFITIEWRPTRDFSKTSAKRLLSYGWKITLGSLLNSVYNECRSLVIGKKYTSDDLAYYNKGKQFPTLFTTNVNSAIGSVTFPLISDYSDDPPMMKKIARQSMQLTSYVTFPLMLGLMAVSKPLIIILLTEKWLIAVWFLRIACIGEMLQPINTVNLQMVKASGRSDMFLKMELIKKLTGVGMVLIAMHFGVKAIAISDICAVIFANLVNAVPNKKLVGYGCLEQLKDLLPNMLCAGVMCAAAFSVGLLGLNVYFTIILQVLVGAAVYLLLSVIFKIKSFYTLIDLIKEKLSRPKEEEA